MKALKSFFCQFITKKITYFLKPVKTSSKWYDTGEPYEAHNFYIRKQDKKAFDEMLGGS